MHDDLLRRVSVWMGVLGPHAPVQGKGAERKRLRHPKVDPALLVFDHVPAGHVQHSTL